MPRWKSKTSTAKWRWANRSCRRFSTAPSEIALPAFVSTLCICIVFVPMFFLAGVARYLFVPLAEAVVFAMLASYVAVPNARADTGDVVLPPHACTMATRRIRRTVQPCVRPFVKIARSALRKASTACAQSYRGLLGVVFAHRLAFAAGLPGLLRGHVPAQSRFWDRTSSRPLMPEHFRLHVRAHTGTRIEETAVRLIEVEDAIRREIPSAELHGILDNIGLPDFRHQPEL